MSTKKGRPKRYMKGRVADYAPAPRTCLTCGKVFASQGPGNRLCPGCDHKRSGMVLSRFD